ncbi:hypothetical protein Taro_038451 [Colocasia esculenta]|uniref:Uncharacterized protein n=1 Tax=Colocasia esculenta TaxID=4460 RepID=A0A843W878_COLES|nr:hypothetical protein [Colocasia esculenta]
MEKQTLVEAALEVLNTADPFEKARLGEDAAARWLRGDISRPHYGESEDNEGRCDPLSVPDRPARLPTVCTNSFTYRLLLLSKEKDATFLSSSSLLPYYLVTSLRTHAGEAGAISSNAEAGEGRELTYPTGHPPQPRSHGELGHRPFLVVHIVRPVPSNTVEDPGLRPLSRDRCDIISPANQVDWIDAYCLDCLQDIIARFGKQESMPTEFFTDFVRVAQDEGRHFTLLEARLRELGSFYGAFPAHDGLWESAMKTSKDLLARLAIEHCVHEARGLDVLPTTISRFRNNGDECTANLLENVVYPEEITHCAAGVKWFRYVCLREHKHVPGGVAVQESAAEVGDCINTCTDQCPNPALECSRNVDGSDDDIAIQTFHAKVGRYFRGSLKPPFNEEARSMAGFAPAWYEPLANKERG